MADDVFGIVGTVQGGAFRVEEAVAEGGFAVVYRAYHGAFRASVALKCLKVPGTLDEQEQKAFLEKFREEAELLFRLSSQIPNIVRPLHVGTLAEARGRFVPFIAIEWLEGNALDQIILQRAESGQPPLSLERTVQILTPVARALERAHHFPTPEGFVSILHRDLKPENIFVCDVGGAEAAKILDFGIAKVKSAATQIVGRQSVDQSALSAFTPAYGAPEQWLPKRYGQTGPWTDVWGLALTAVECLCGHTPIDGDHASMMGSALDPDRRPTPRSEGALVPDSVEAVFEQALAVDPRDRFHEVGAFWSALEASLRDAGLPVDAQPTAPRISEPRARTFDPHDGTELAGAGRAISSSSAGGGSAAAGDRFGNTIDLIDPPHNAPLALDTMEGIGLAPSPRRPPIARHASPARGPREEGRPLDLKLPLKLLIASIVLMAGDWTYASVTGEVLQLGPARMLWLAGPMAIAGAVILISRLLAHAE